MPDTPGLPNSFEASILDASILAQLACPACRGDLRMVEDHLT